MSKDFKSSPYPLVVAFRTESGFNTSPIQIRLVGNLAPYPIIGANNSDVIPVADLTRAEFDALGGNDIVKAAFSKAVAKIRSHDGFSKPRNKAERFANNAVARASKEILTTFGTAPSKLQAA